jgi:hypothetical protein
MFYAEGMPGPPGSPALPDAQGGGRQSRSPRAAARNALCVAANGVPPGYDTGHRAKDNGG